MAARTLSSLFSTHADFHKVKEIIASNIEDPTYDIPLPPDQHKKAKATHVAFADDRVADEKAESIALPETPHEQSEYLDNVDLEGGREHKQFSMEPASHSAVSKEGPGESSSPSTVPALSIRAALSDVPDVPGTPGLISNPSTPPVGLVDAHDYFPGDVDHSQVPLETFRKHLPPHTAYTRHLSVQPPQRYLKTLKVFNGRLRADNWFKVAARPFYLFAYPAVLWSSVIYACSIGWLIVLSESVSTIYQAEPYNFTPLQTGLVYIGPFIGGVIGTAIAGKVSDIVVRFMARRNGGIYEPEFRLVMAIPVAISTSVGLMGFGWSAQVHDSWIVPTIFFGIISFGCSLGSTTAITFCVDSYRQYAGEALVTLNFSKNIFHGLMFSLFFNDWLDSDGSKNVFLALGGIQLACLVFTIPLYIFGKRARMWTVRKKFLERL
jgi:hypothetical protein